MTDNIRHLRLADTTDSRIERGLRALTDLIKDEAITGDVRGQLQRAHAALHACRSPATVAQLESEFGIGPEAA